MGALDASSSIADMATPVMSHAPRPPKMYCGSSIERLSPTFVHINMSHTRLYVVT